MLVACGALLCESMVWMLWCQCQSQAGRTWRTDGTTKRLGKPLLISAWGSAGTFRPVECVYTCVCVCVCVCVGWRPAAEWSWDVKDDTCVSAGEGVCCHCQWGWDWSTSLLALISVSIPPFLLFLIRGSCSEPRLILGQWVAGLWGIFWGSFWNVLCHSITTREQWRKWSLWLNTLATSFLSVNI